MAAYPEDMENEPLPNTPNALDGRGQKTGMWTDADSHGGVMVGEYVEDRRQGEWRHFATDGRLRSHGFFLDGELDRDWTCYRASGELMQRGGFLRGAKHGVWERWNAAGEPIDRGTFDDGRKVGDWHVLHPDGSIKRTTRHRAK